MSDILIDIPDITVIVDKGDEYKVVINKPNQYVQRVTGSYYQYADVAGVAATASYVEGSGLPSGTISSSQQIKENLPTGTVSSSTQINTGSFTGSFVGDGSQLTGLVTDLRISGSTGSDTLSLLTDTLLITGSNGVSTAVTNNTVTITAPQGTVSSSQQIDVRNTTGIQTLATTGSNVFSGYQTIYGTLEIDSGNIVITSGNSLIVSGAIFAQNEFIGALISANSVQATSITGSFKGDGSQLTGLVTELRISGSTGSDALSLLNDALLVNGTNGITTTVTDNTITINLPLGVVSSSAQVTSLLPSNVVSSSTQVQALLPDGTVSSSAQYPGWVTASSQIQLNAITGTTFSNASFLIPQDLTVAGTLTAEKLQIEYISSSVIYESGSTKFGDSLDDTHQFTGSVSVLGSVTAQSFTGSFSGSLNVANTASYVEWNSIDNKPAGIVSSSVQINTGSFSGSFKGDGSQLTGLVTDLRISGSTGSDTLSLLTDDLTIVGQNGIVTTITDNTIIIDVPTALTASLYGTASVAEAIDIIFAGNYDTGSDIPYTPNWNVVSASYALTASYAEAAMAILPDGVVSSSTQILDYNIFATTGSNNFVGNQTITGSLTVSGSSTFTNIGPTILSGAITITAGITGSLFGTSSFAVTASKAITASYVQSDALPSGLISSSTQIATLGTIRLTVGTSRANASAFYFNSNTKTAGDSASPTADTAFLINSTGLSTVTVYLRQDNAGPNATVVGVAKNANGTAFSGATLVTSSSLNLAQDTIQTYTFSGLSLSQFDVIHIYCDPTNTPGVMFGVVVVS